MKRLCEIIAENKKAVTFPLLDFNYTVSADRIVYIQIRDKYIQIADAAKTNFSAGYSKFTSLDDMYSKIESLFAVAIEDGINEVSRDAVSVECYTLDGKAVLNECMKQGHFEPFLQTLQEIAEKDEAIISEFADAKNFREFRKNTRARWTSATYGGNIFDAWNNQLKAGAMNAVEGIGHSLKNAIGNAVDEAQAAEKRAQLFNNKVLRDKLFHGVWSCANNLRMVITNYLSHISGITFGGWVSNNDAETAESMFNNLMKIQVDDNKRKELAVQILSLNPFVERYYLGLMKLFLDQGEEILAVADFFKMSSVRQKLSEILVEFTKIHLGNTPAELNNCRIQVLEIAQRMKIDDSSMQKAIQCINQHGEKILIAFVNANIGTTEENAQNCKRKLEALAQQMNLNVASAPQPFVFVHERIRQLDEQYRTVNGVILDTRDSADRARNDVDIYSDLLGQAEDFRYVRDFLLQIEKVKALPIDEKLKQHYIDELNVKLRNFKEYCQQASRYQYRLDHHKTIFWNGDKKDMGIHYGIFAVLLFFVIRAYVERMGTAEYIVGAAMVIGYIIYFFIFRIGKEKELWASVTSDGAVPYSEIIQEADYSGIDVTTLICHNCKTANLTSDTYCKNCGKPLST